MKTQTSNHSILSSKYNDQKSTVADQNSLYSTNPIHSLSQTFFSHSQYNNSQPKPAFGTSSIRQIKELEGKKQSDIVAYSRINYQKNQKYYEPYEQYQPKITPFMSTSGRFSNKKTVNPGPGSYKLPEIFKSQQQNKKSHNSMNCPFKNQQVKHRNHTGRNQEQQKDTIFYYNQSNYVKNNYQLKQRIKQRRDQMKAKMLKLKQLTKKPQIVSKSDFKRMGFTENQEIKVKSNDLSNKRLEEQKVTKSTNANNIYLRQITNKYLPKKQFEFEREDYRTGSQIKGFRQINNHQPIFLMENKNLFSSYITKSDVPGPGYYEKRTKQIPKNNASQIKKYFL